MTLVMVRGRFRYAYGWADALLAVEVPDPLLSYSFHQALWAFRRENLLAIDAPRASSGAGPRRVIWPRRLDLDQL